MDTTHYKILKFIKDNPSIEPDANEIGAGVGCNTVKTESILLGMEECRLIKRHKANDDREIWRIDDFGDNLQSDEAARQRFPFIIGGVALLAMVIGLLIGTMVGKSKPMDTSRVVETLKKGVLKNYLDKSEFKARTKNYATKGYVASYVKKRMVKPKSKKKAKVTKKRKSSRSKKRRRR